MLTAAIFSIKLTISSTTCVFKESEAPACWRICAAVATSSVPSSTTREPSSIVWNDSSAFSSIRFSVSLILAVERLVSPASLRISPATTANPRPCSPTLAASIEALSERRFVWVEISSITFSMPAISLVVSAKLRRVRFVSSTLR
ncbi:hypothetical protein D3C81_1790840 [compost metagenome]